jgi:8-oxo-dGTP pyrophosphatase MutT (NUDIX family)
LRRSEKVVAVDVPALLTQPQALRAHVQAVLGRPGGATRELPAGVRRAAVLIALGHARGEAALLLTMRSHLVEHHKGQISLPGGVVEPGESPLDAALRETSEEIGVRAQDVTVLGALDEEETVVSGFMLTPFVGSIPYPYPLRVSPAEVHRVLEVSIRTLLDPQNIRAELWDQGGVSRLMYFYRVGTDVVWGATARIIMQFLRRVFPAATPPDGDIPVAHRRR